MVFLGFIPSFPTEHQKVCVGVFFFVEVCYPFRCGFKGKLRQPPPSRDEPLRGVFVFVSFSQEVPPLRMVNPQKALLLMVTRTAATACIAV